jgi:hypothetical protein
MEYAKLNTLLPLIRPDVPQCPDITIEQYMVRMARDFCTQSRVWQQWINEPVDPDIETYPLRVDNGDIVTVNTVQTEGGVPLKALDYTLPGQEEDNMQAIAGVQGYTFDPPDTLHIQGTPTQPMELFVRVALKPTMVEASAPAWLVDRYEEALISGTLYRLMMLTGKTWSNPDFAAVHKDTFLRGVSSARIDELKKHTNASLSIKPRPFGA